MRKYTAFDLFILHINLNSQQVPINLHNIDVSRPANTTHPGCTTYEVQPSDKTPHAARDEQSVSSQNIAPAARRPTLVHQRDLSRRLQKNHVGHKYCKTKLLINDNVKAIIQHQRKIPCTKRVKLNKIWDELEE